MITLYYNSCKKSLLLPESWNECSSQQLIGLSRILRLRMEEQPARVAALKVLLNKRRFAFCLMKADLKARILPLLDWCFNANTLTEQRLPSFRGRYGPKSRLLNMRMNEWHACEMFYRMMVDDVEMAREKLIAVLYRPGRFLYNHRKDEKGDARRAYNSNLIEHDAHIIKRWPEDVKFAILLYYDGCRQHIVKSFQSVFDSPEQTLEEQFQGMFLMIRGIAADGKYGDFDKVESMYVYTALNEVCAALREQKELEAKMEQERR